MNPSFALTYASHSSFPLAKTPSGPATPVAVLDSSFNPPHLAHLALALHHPSPAPAATLLVLSTKNVDKVPKPGEPTSDDKLEMMHAMAVELERHGLTNIGIARIDEPTFVGKSKVLRAGLEAGLPKGESVRLSFLLGWDTLIRFFDDKYYQPPAPSMHAALSTFFVEDQSSLACARRGDVSPEAEERFLNKEGVREWRDRVVMFDVPEEVRGVSSTMVRSAVAEGGGSLDGVLLESVRRIVKERGYYQKL